MPKTRAKTKAGRQRKAGLVMKEFRAGKLRSGSKTGRRVKSRKQAIAIALSESGQARRPGPARKKLEGRKF